MDSEDRIIVVDSFPGSGKSSAAIKHINELDDDTKVIFITPYLSEVQRIIDLCPSKNFHQPNPRNGEGSKMNHLFKLIINGENVVSTHALFKGMNDQLIDLLRANDYILFLDEVFQTVEKYNISEEYLKNEEKDEVTKKDIEVLIAQGHVKIEDDFKVTWINLENPLSKYLNLISLCQRELLYYVNNSLLIWTFPIEIFREGIFSKIFILTYQFESQLQCYYYRYFDIKYSKYIAVEKDGQYYFEKSDNNKKESSWRKNIRDKIHIIEDHKINRIGDPFKDTRNQRHDTALSKSWYDRNSSSINILKNNLLNYFQNIAKSKSEERMWTSFKEDVNKLKSRNLSPKSWLACNARATNDYRNKTVLAYLLNRYLDPFYDDFFERKGINVNQDAFALSEMIQWIWRSAIRNNQKITLYIPSKRMRELLIKFLNEDIQKDEE